MIVSAWPWIQIPIFFQRRHSVAVLSFIGIASQTTAVTRVSMAIFIYTGITEMHSRVSVCLSLFLCVHVHACLWVLVHLYIHKEVRGQHQVASSIAFYLVSFLNFFFWDSVSHKTQSSLIHLGWPFSEPCESACLPSPAREFQILPLPPTFMWRLGSKFWSTCLPDSYQLIHLPSPVQHLWNILNVITSINIIANVDITNVRISISNISTNFI